MSFLELSPEERRQIAIAAHNAEIDSQIANCEKLKEKYQKVQTDATKISSEIESASNSASLLSKRLEEIIINNIPFDNGSIDLLSTNLGEISQFFSNITSKCSEKFQKKQSEIDYLKTQYW